MAPGDYSQAIDIAINAGIDMVMVPNAYRDFIARLKALVAAGRVPMARIDDAVRRILKQKVRFKLWEKPFTDRALTAEIGSPAHREVARDAVRKSLVVLKNDKQTLPLRKDSARAPVRPAGRQHGRAVRRLVGRLARPARRHHARAPPSARRSRRWLARRASTYSENAAGAEKADVVVAVVGEDPYAEGSGDRAKLELGPQDLALIDAAKRSGKPLVVVLLIGRPLILGDVLDAAERGGRGLAAGHRGRRRRRRAVRRVQADGQAVRARGRPTCRRSRSTSAIPATRRCSRTATA